jgi:hypothetical protein
MRLPVLGFMLLIGVVVAAALFLASRSPHSEVISSEIHEIDANTQSLARGIGSRTASERLDFLMQDTPDDLFSAAATAASQCFPNTAAVNSESRDERERLASTDDLAVRDVPQVGRFVGRRAISVTVSASHRRAGAPDAGKRRTSDRRSSAWPVPSPCVAEQSTAVEAPHSPPRAEF